MRFPWRRQAPAEVVAPASRRPAPAPPPPAAPVPSGSELADLEEQARYRREKVSLYRARMQGAHPTSTGRLEELERAATAADDRLRTARRLAGS